MAPCTGPASDRVAPGVAWVRQVVCAPFWAKGLLPWESVRETEVVVLLVRGTRFFSDFPRNSYPCSAPVGGEGTSHPHPLTYAAHQRFHDHDPRDLSSHA